MRGKNLVKLQRALLLICRSQGASVDELSGELGIDRRSVYRLLDTIESMGVPIYDEKETFGRVVRKKADDSYRRRFQNANIPDLKLTLPEIIALYSLRRNEPLYEGTEIEKEILSAFSKIDTLLPGALAKHLSRIRMLFISSSKFAKDYSGKEEIFDTLTGAILQCKTCNLKYQSFHPERISEFEADPLHFFERDGGVYLIYRSPKHGTVRILAVERILEITETDKTYIYPEDLDPKGFLDGSFNITQEEPFRVKIWFSANEAKYIKERTWSKTQKIIDNPDGSITLEMGTSGAWEIKRWVLGYGREAEVIEPPEFRSEIIATLKETLKNYK